tara:strand:- start:202 stop:405 length:204 start_codon:yes stop_codon:yes gene_type:complete
MKDKTNYLFKEKQMAKNKNKMIIEIVFPEYDTDGVSAVQNCIKDLQDNFSLDTYKISYREEGDGYDA